MSNVRDPVQKMICAVVSDRFSDSTALFVEETQNTKMDKFTVVIIDQRTPAITLRKITAQVT